MGYWHDMSGWDYVWMTGMMIFWIVAVVGAIWAAVALARRDGGRPAPSAQAELDRGLARGELTEDEYQRRRDLTRSA